MAPPGRPLEGSRLLVVVVVVVVAAAAAVVADRGFRKVKLPRLRTGGRLCVCDDTHEPVCASNLFTYDNRCKLECAAALAYPVVLFELHEGPCKEEDKRVILGLKAEGGEGGDDEEESEEEDAEAETTSTSTAATTTSTTTEKDEDKDPE